MLRIIEVTANPKRAKPAKKKRAKRAKPRKEKQIRPGRGPSLNRIIVGNVAPGYGAQKHLFWTGNIFDRSKRNAKKYSASAAKSEAKRILPNLPACLASIQVERI